MDKTCGEITPEMISKWKEKYGNNSLRLITLSDKNTSLKFVIRVPSKSVIISLVGLYRQNAPDAQSNEMLISRCVLHGDMEQMEKNGGLYTKLLAAIKELIPEPPNKN